jgi:hypothetical protein
VTDHVSRLRAKAAQLRAEYRHEWDYGTEQTARRALLRLALAEARLMCEEFALERGINNTISDDHVRGLCTDTFIAQFALPRKK